MGISERLRVGDLLFDPEREHARLLPDHILDRLRIAHTGLGLCQGLAADNVATLFERVTVQTLLVRKAAEHIGTASQSLLVGHYQSAPVLLRVAAQTIGMLMLNMEAPRRFDNWMFLTLARRRWFRGKTKDFDAMVRELEGESKAYYNSSLGRPDEKGPVLDRIRRYNTYAHPSMAGIIDWLLDGLGSNREQSYAATKMLTHWFGTDVHKALRTANRDPGETLKGLHAVLARSGPNVSETEDESNVDIRLAPARPQLLDALSTDVLAATHHLFDVAVSGFDYPADADQRKAASRWHEESLAIMDDL